MNLALADAGVAHQDVDYINAHGTSPPHNDISETRAIKDAFGPHAYRLAVSSTKSMTGHLMGSAGAVEAIASVLALEHGLLPPTINYCSPDPECDLDYEPNHARRRSIGVAVSNSFGFGGEPTLVPRRVMAFVEAMEYVTISTNGLCPLPRAGFERVSVGITLFGGGRLDDELRAIRPGGQTFTGLFDTALRHYRHDPRAIFNVAITGRGLDHIEPTVRRIRDNGNRVTFNFYSEYHKRTTHYGVRTTSGSSTRRSRFAKPTRTRSWRIRTISACSSRDGQTSGTSVTTSAQASAGTTLATPTAELRASQPSRCSMSTRPISRPFSSAVRPAIAPGAGTVKLSRVGF